MIMKKLRAHRKEPHFNIDAYWRGTHWELHIDRPDLASAYVAPDDDFNTQVHIFLWNAGYNTTEASFTYHYPQIQP